MVSSNKNLCCAYPHGERPILPQIFTLFSVICSFGVFPVWGDGNYIFACIDDRCFAMRLVSEDYWDRERRWSGAIQIGTAMAIFAAMFGFVALSLLMSASCFQLEESRISGIHILLCAAASFQAATFVAVGADPRTDNEVNRGLDTGDIEVKTGALYSIFAVLFYVASAVLNRRYYRSVYYEHQNMVSAGNNSSSNSHNKGEDDLENAPLAESDTSHSH